MLNEMKKLLFCTIVYFAAQHSSCHSQVVQSSNAPRDGDCLIGYKLRSKNLDAKGKNTTWNLSKASLGEKKHKKYWAYVCDNPDSLCYTENRTIHYIKPEKNQLLSLGFEDNQMKVEFDKPISYALFPMDYDDSKEGSFVGSCSYCDKVQMRVLGKYKLTADATGKIIVPETSDTLYNVIRIRRNTTIATYCNPTNYDHQAINTTNTEQTLTSDSLTLTYEERRWYVRGYRYPVIESFTTYLPNRKEIANIAYYYPPSEQYDVAYDYDNEREKERVSIAARNYVQSTRTYNNNKDNLYYIINEESAHKTTIHFNNGADGEIKIILSDVSGIVVMSITKSIDNNNDISFEYGNLRHGQYTMYIETCGNRYSENFIVR